MGGDERKVIHRKDYIPPAYLIPEIRLEVDLGEASTRVRSWMRVIPNDDSPLPKGECALNGNNLKLLSITMDGVPLKADRYSLSETLLTIHDVPVEFVLETESEIHPEENKALEGLYRSGNVFCTQNEPEGFRRITWFIDRPDVMTRITTRITADRDKYPVLLSNGNLTDAGDLPDGRHFAVWSDPFPKPCYLYALVAGNLGLLRDEFVTRNGRKIDLRIYCDQGNESKCGYAMEALKKAMRWDEQRFGLEYDLDIYMIVAVDAFNMGAMENKGLNIFNSQYILADVATATDMNFLNIERVVAHEYFHNWSGNRVTCRDWFQLTLKEGLTVFRDQEFSSDIQSRPVKRIEDVNKLRVFQFPEDSGPTSHPIRPDSYIEINNFYTVTVYEKGSEVIRMIHTLLGEEAFMKGMRNYFKLHDGKAITCDDFIAAFESANGIELTQFRRWYEQAGTPVITVSHEYDESARELRLALTQETPPTTGQPVKKPLHMPFLVSLLGRDGREIAIDGEVTRTKMVQLSDEKHVFVFRNIPERPVLSLNRNFSAPVRVRLKRSFDELLFLFTHDSDAFNRWDAGQEAALAQLRNIADDFHAGKETHFSREYVEAWMSVLSNGEIDYYYKSQLLRLPSEQILAQEYDPIDFDAIHAARTFLKRTIGTVCHSQLRDLYAVLRKNGEYRVDMESIGMRDLRLLCLDFLAASGERDDAALAFGHFLESKNMTDEIGSLAILAEAGTDERERALDIFYRKWKDVVLVMMKWFSVQASSRLASTLNRVMELESNPAYDEKIPNLVRSLVGSFAQNQARFHEADGRGYIYLADKIIRIDSFNPSISSMLAKSFKLFPKLDEKRKSMMGRELERILAYAGISRNTYEIVVKTLEAGARSGK